MAIQLRLLMMFIHAVVFIRCMKWTLILSATSLRGPKITEQISRKIGSEHGPLRRALGTLGESNPLPHPLLVPWIINNTIIIIIMTMMMMMMMIIINCGDGTNSPDVSATIAETFFFLSCLCYFNPFSFSPATSLQSGRDYTYCYSSVCRYWRVHQRYWWLSQFTCFLYQHSGIL